MMCLAKRKKKKKGVFLGLGRRGPTIRGAQQHPTLNFCFYSISFSNILITSQKSSSLLNFNEPVNISFFLFFFF